MKEAKTTTKTANPKNKDIKESQKKSPDKKTNKQPNKIAKTPKKEPAKKATKKIANADKVLPWEDIVPPK